MAMQIVSASTLTIRAITVKPTAEASIQSLKGDITLLLN